MERIYRRLSAFSCATLSINLNLRLGFLIIDPDALGCISTGTAMGNLN
jgi:hypothetical protein